jgi:hypothetical protein
MMDFLTYRLVDLDHTNIGLLEVFYFGFNGFEAVAWFVIAAIVFRRWQRNRKTGLEVAYALLFLLFGITDVLELDSLPVWRLLVKAVICVMLFAVRYRIITVVYPGAKF